MKLRSIFVAAMLYAALIHETKAQTTIPASQWTTGAMPDTTGNGTPTTTNLKQLVIPNANLKPLTVTLGGPNLIVCNNPERFTGNGWLFQHSYTDATQGGVDYPLSGTTRIYMFHLNFTNPGVTKYVHLVVHNPGAAAVTYSFKGRNYTNAAGDKPLTGAATGQSYWVSRDWLTNTLSTGSGSIAANSKLVVFTKQVNSSNMFDALYEVTTSGPVYYYTVVTTNNSAADARAAASVGSPYASFAVPPDPRVTQSDYRMETGGTYARGAGVFPASEVSSDNILVIPNSPSRIGFCYNTSNKFYPMLEKQNPAVVVKTPPTTDSVRSLYSSSHNYGNYGMRYNTMFRLQNNSSTTKTVRVYFAENENLVDAASASARWNSMFKVNGTNVDAYIQGNNPRKLLAIINVPTGTTNFPVEVYIPGLITTNHQLIFETITSGAITLPVNLTSFNATGEKMFNRLEWKAEEERNLSHYEVERKTGDEDFVSIKTIAARNNNGAQQYRYDDAEAALSAGKKYYRLKMVNEDGTYKYSDIVNVINKAAQIAQVMGNPFSSKLTVQLNTAEYANIKLNLYDASGKKVRTAVIHDNSATLTYSFTDLAMLKPGVYTLEVIAGETRQAIGVVKAVE